MTTNVVVFDRRVGIPGVPTVPKPLPDSHVILTDRMTTLDRLVGDILDLAKAHQGIGVLRLLCKPIVSHVRAADPLNGKWNYWMGLLLASGLDPEGPSYGTFAPLRGQIRSIVVHAGLAFSYANRQAQENAPVADGGAGRLLMQQLADVTRADVVAPDTQQSSESLGTAWDLYKGRPWVLDFGAWEGQLWRYSPGGKRPVRHDV